MAVRTTVEVREYTERGKVCHYTFTQHEGLATYTDKDIDQGKPFLAVLATFKDYGKQGVSRCYTRPPAPVTEEEKASNLAQLERALNEALHRRGVTDCFTVTVART